MGLSQVSALESLLRDLLVYFTRVLDLEAAQMVLGLYVSTIVVVVVDVAGPVVLGLLVDVWFALRWVVIGLRVQLAFHLSVRFNVVL